MGGGLGPQKLFFLLLLAAYGGEQQKKEVGQLPHAPSQGLTSLEHSASGAAQMASNVSSENSG
jgi:hypothetical protein